MNPQLQNLKAQQYYAEEKERLAKELPDIKKALQAIEAKWNCVLTSKLSYGTGSIQAMLTPDPLPYVQDKKELIVPSEKKLNLPKSEIVGATKEDKDGK